MTVAQSLAADAEIFHAVLCSNLRGITVDYRAERGDWPASWRGRHAGAQSCVYGDTPADVIRLLERDAAVSLEAAP